MLGMMIDASLRKTNRLFPGEREVEEQNQTGHG